MIDRRTFLRTTLATAACTYIAPSMNLSSMDFNHPIQERYPDPAIVVLDKRFEKYYQFNASVERLWTGSRWAEGPVWFGDGRFLLYPPQIASGGS